MKHNLIFVAQTLGAFIKKNDTRRANFKIEHRCYTAVKNQDYKAFSKLTSSLWHIATLDIDHCQCAMAFAYLPYLMFVKINCSHSVVPNQPAVLQIDQTPDLKSAAEPASCFIAFWHLKYLFTLNFEQKAFCHLLLCYLCDITTDAGSTFLTPRNIIWQKCSHLWRIAMLIISSSSHNTISRSLLISNSLNLVKPSNKWNRQTMIDVTIAYIHIKDFNDPSSNIQNPPLYFKLSNSATAWTSN